MLSYIDLTAENCGMSWDTELQKIGDFLKLVSKPEEKEEKDEHKINRVAKRKKQEKGFNRGTPTSRFNGVSLISKNGMYQTKMMKDNICYRLLYFKSEADSAQCFNILASILHGEDYRRKNILTEEDHKNRLLDDATILKKVKDKIKAIHDEKQAIQTSSCRTKRQQKKKKRYDKHTSSFRGVSFRKRHNQELFYSRLMKDGVNYNLGQFSRESDAAVSVNFAAQILYGKDEYYKLNVLTEEQNKSREISDDTLRKKVRKIIKRTMGKKEKKKKK
jgi:hypothetical protein